jgi:cobalt-zinc-cadmium efflux system outer membrane protein
MIFPPRIQWISVLLSLALFSCVTSYSVRSQERSIQITKPIVNPAFVRSPQERPAATSKKSITISDAVAIFLRQNLALVAARYDIDTVDAERLTAGLRPNPEISVGFSDVPLTFNDNFVKPQTFTYDVSQTFELGGKRKKRIETANANSEVARAEFQTVVWQALSDLKKKFYAVVLAQSLLNLARENQTTFAEIIKHTAELVQAGELAGLDLTRLEVEQLKFDTDVANSEKDYAVALRDLRIALGGDYRAMDVEVAGSLDPEPFTFSLKELVDEAMSARPDLKVAQLSEHAADAAIKLQNAQRIPDLTLGGGVEQIPSGGSTYNFGVGIPLPIHDRNQGERAKALIEKSRAQNLQHLVTNQIMGDVDKALVAFESQKRRVELYRTGVLAKVDNIQRLTEFSLKAGESSTLELLDAIRTRRDTLAGFYQTLFDYQNSLLDIELATATPIKK